MEKKAQTIKANSNDSRRKWQYRVSLIVPIYNMEKYLKTCFDSILHQSIDYRDVEVLMIDDGSKDHSLDIMKQYSRKYANFKTFTKENEGLSKTRNFGIKHATGKYIMYLDPDDYFGKDTIRNVCDFFDNHYDEVDVVTYKIIPIRNGVEQKLHFRYEILDETGIYDLKELNNSFICHTNVNTCVKNKFADNVLFSEVKGFRHEDQKYNIDTLREKEKIGYCEDAEYYYIRQSNSITGTVFHAYYIFETTMKFWEAEFSKYSDHVPYYIQALFFSDINWKMRSNILLPYHYEGEEYVNACNRIISLLKKCDNEIIINHPNVKKEHVLFWLKKKEPDNLSVLFKDTGIDVICGDDVVTSEKKIALTLEYLRIKNNVVSIHGILKPLYTSVKKDVQLKLIGNDGEYILPIKMRTSALSMFKTHEVTNDFYFFKLDIEIDKVKNFKFVVDAGGNEYSTDIHYSNRIPFRHNKNGLFVRNSTEVRYGKKKNLFEFKTLTDLERKRRSVGLFRRTAKNDVSFAVQQLRLSAKKRQSPEIWLYYDCRGYARDNGYFQFEHDVKKNDGVQRYYILNDDNFAKAKKSFPKEIQGRVIKFGSAKHTKLFLLAKYIITAFAERENLLPLTMKEFKKYSQILDFPEVIYLQHGILHAHVPWKYSIDRIKIDKEVISSTYEKNNLIRNYGFSEDELIPAGMPRYDYVNHTQQPKKKILFAPTWRNYLVKRNGDEWEYSEEKFKKSKFYKSLLEFLNDDRLDSALKAYGYSLDFKLHPIFRGYSDCFHPKSERVNVVTNDINIADYEIFITDFSSFVFDFVYLNRKVIYFIPDYDFFMSGMNGYSELDLPVEDGFGPFVQDAESAVNTLVKTLEGEASPIYNNKLEEFFLFKDNHQRDRIYNALKSMK